MIGQRPSHHDELAAAPRRARLGWLWLATTLPVLTVAAADVTSPPTKPLARRESRPLRDYSLLYQRNIFLSTRHAPRVRVSRPPTRVVSRPAAPIDPLAGWVLRGTLARDGGFVAILEHPAAQKIHRLEPGQSFLGQEIDDVTFRGLSLRGTSGDEREVLVGQYLSRQIARVTPPAAPIAASTPTSRPTGEEAPVVTADAGTPTTAPAAGPMPPPSGGTQSVLEMLRARRQREGTGRP